VDGDSLDAHFAARALNAQRNFATIGYYNFVEHFVIARLVGLPLIDNDQCLAIFDGFTILYTNGFHNTGYVGLDLIHHFHGLNDA
jgi:hypothetical protein